MNSKSNPQHPGKIETYLPQTARSIMTLIRGMKLSASLIFNHLLILVLCQCPTMFRILFWVVLQLQYTPMNTKAERLVWIVPTVLLMIFDRTQFTIVIVVYMSAYVLGRLPHIMLLWTEYILDRIETHLE